MRSAKYIGLFAACGFILSFVSGLFSHSSILSVLLKALIFAVVFGLLGFGISFIYSKFLSDGSGGDYQGDYSPDASSSSVQSSPLGQNVDITIEDEELRPSESDNHFVVGDRHQMLNDSDVREAASGGGAAEKDPSQGFVPLRNFETVQNISGKEAVIPAEAVTPEPAQVNNAAAANYSAAASPFPASANAEGGIDTLPDMENFVFSDGSDSDSDDDDSDSGTEAEFFSSSGASKKKDGPAEVQDAALMAKAISSVLSDENS